MKSRTKLLDCLEVQITKKHDAHCVEAVQTAQAADEAAKLRSSTTKGSLAGVRTQRMHVCL